jgi:hypothetical protein
MVALPKCAGSAANLRRSLLSSARASLSVDGDCSAAM